MAASSEVCAFVCSTRLACAVPTDSALPRDSARVLHRDYTMMDYGLWRGDGETAAAAMTATVPAAISEVSVCAPSLVTAAATAVSRWHRCG